MPKQAVFLSYASEDATAALRICESLRAAGIEVWFDQSELRGGDVWDRQIKKQVHECALFIAVVSAHSNARTEGYFRREWRLAVERTHDIAEDAPFLLPVTIDDTTEGSARVPDQFREVQWTRLRDGATTKAFTDRVLRLLASDPAVAAPAVAAAATPRAAIKHAQQLVAIGPAWLMFALLLIGAGYIGVRQFLSSRPGAAPAGAAVAAANDSGSRAQRHSRKVRRGAAVCELKFGQGAGVLLGRLDRGTDQSVGKIPELRVSARTSSFYFKGKPTMIADVAKMLGVANVLEGSVRKSGKHGARHCAADSRQHRLSDLVGHLRSPAARYLQDPGRDRRLGDQRPRAVVIGRTATARRTNHQHRGVFAVSPCPIDQLSWHLGCGPGAR